MTAASPKAGAVAFSYIRFSTPEQLKGDSLRRQTDLARAWCDRNGAHLDMTRTLHDLGKSAFKGAHRANPDRNALAAFLKLVEEGKVARGSYLLVESLDRLTREHIRPALTLLLNLIEAGVRIVQLKPVEVVYDENVEPMTLMMALMELSRGNSESKVKSQRNGAAWVQKRKYAREHKGQLLTRMLPSWIEERDGKLFAIPAKAAAVQRVYRLAAQGFGANRIVRQLIADRVPPLVETFKKNGKSKPGCWLQSYVTALLNDRRVVGEFQPRTRDRVPDGPPIPRYFPQVIAEDEWLLARAAVRARRVVECKGKGSYEKSSGFVNIFVGLLYDALDGSSCIPVWTGPSNGRGRGRRVLRNTACLGRGQCRSFPLETFERAILGALAEVDPAEVLAGEERPDERLAAAAELERVAQQVGRIKDNILTGGDVASLADVLRQLEAKQHELAEQEQAARERDAAPLERAWKSLKRRGGLLDVLDKSPDPADARLRLRAALRRVVEVIQLLVIPRGHDRACVVQVWFAGGKKHRDYVILHRPPRANGKTRTEGQWWVRSLASVASGDDLDLRNPADAKKLEVALAEDDLESSE